MHVTQCIFRYQRMINRDIFTDDSDISCITTEELIENRALLTLVTDQCPSPLQKAPFDAEYFYACFSSLKAEKKE